MLADNDVYAMIPVNDVEKAKDFYKNILGLKELEAGPGGLFYKSGNTKIMVYESKYAGTNKGTAANWDVANVDQIAKDLKSKGVVFEQYDYPGTSREGDVHVMGNIRAVWFKDPSGNILGVTQS